MYTYWSIVNTTINSTETENTTLQLDFIKYCPIVFDRGYEQKRNIGDSIYHCVMKTRAGC